MKLPEIMTIEEVAEYLRVSERTVYDWAQKGEIPSGKLGTAWRFKRQDIEQWIDHHLAGEKKKSDLVPLFLDNVLKSDRVLVIESATKQEILDEMITMMSEASEVKSKDELSKGIYHREQLMSTGIGLGIAIPHVRLRSVKDVIMGAALVREGVKDYESLDSIPVKLIFMIVAREDQHAQHIKLLSQISTRLKDEEQRKLLMDCTDSKSFYLLLTGRR